MAWIPLVIMAAAAAGKAISKKKAAGKQAKNSKTTGIAQMKLQNNVAEDKRLSKLDLAKGLLGDASNPNAPAAAYGGRVNPNTGLDPAMMAKLGIRRNYDSQIEQAVGDPGAGGGWDLGGDLFGAVQQGAAGYASGGMGGGGIGGGLVQGLGGAKSGTAAGGPGTGLSFEELMKLRGGA